MAENPLEARIRARIKDQGGLRFVDFMAMALYEPGLGYYAHGTRQVGKGGDFFTSVSVGPVFGELLARRFLHEWETLGRPPIWRITECGAHDGTLARDILTTLANLRPDALAGLQYTVIEPLERLREAQRLTLRDHSRHLHQYTTADSLPPLPGIVFGNEVLDALPCHLVECHDGHWQEFRVIIDHNERLSLALHPIEDPELQAALLAIGHEFPSGYRTEVRTNLRRFLSPLAAQLQNGTMIWIDYGFSREDYYHPTRHCGTLRTFDHHQAGDDPLESPGQRDITAHVDFTTLAETATGLGGMAAALQKQGSWLTALAREWLLSMEGQAQPQRVRQFQTLTHPGQLGGSFSVMEITFGESRGAGE